jgi:endonuclease/exonuclease/phosphatase family metal-dependent hydrolase
LNKKKTLREEDKMPNINIAWWNLENLFDHETASRDDALKAALKSELKGWTAAVRNKKISQLSKIIELMFDGKGPSLLGVCEAENESVVQKLAETINIPGREYAVICHESHDARGIDTSFIFDSKELKVLSTDHQVVIKRTATRDIFWARLQVKSTGAEFVAIANHWPARSAGQYTSEPFRILAAETHAYIVSRLIDETRGGDKNLPIISMGDYNDEPFNRSVQEYALGTRDPGRVRYSRSGHLLNLMWQLMHGHDPGTYLYASDWNMLDQFMVSYGMLRGPSKVRVDTQSVIVFKPDFMVASSGKPRRFSRPSVKKGADMDGFSDHFPITVKLIT